MSRDADAEAGERRSFWQLAFSAPVMAALVTAIMGLVGYWVSTRVTSMQLLNQRETAQTELRSAMLGHLIKPFVGDPPKEQGLPAHQARILLELLTLNFHDQFEFKPLLDETYRRLLDECDKEGASRGGRMTTVSCADYRELKALRSVARRVSDRQIVMLHQTHPATDYRIDFMGVRWLAKPGSANARSDDLEFELQGACDAAGKRCDYAQRNLPQQAQCRLSPDGLHVLRIGVLRWDPVEYSAVVTMQLAKAPSPDIGKRHRDSAAPAQSGGGETAPLLKEFCASSGAHWTPYPDFSLGPFDFPLTDNRSLDEKRRVAMVLDGWITDAGAPSGGRLFAKLVWFPTGYVTDRERPMNPQEIRGLVGLDQ